MAAVNSAGDDAVRGSQGAAEGGLVVGHRAQVCPRPADRAMAGPLQLWYRRLAGERSPAGRQAPAPRHMSSQRAASRSWARASAKRGVGCPERRSRLVRRRPLANRTRSHWRELAEAVEVGGDDDGDDRVAAGRLVVDEEHDGPPVGRGLDRSRDDAV